MSLERKLPTGRLGRLARLTHAGARTASSLLFGRDGTAAAQQTAEILGSLRGLAAKAGQMASYVDGFVPDEQRAAYEGALRSLCAAAPRSAPAAIRAVVEDELHAPLRELFSEWDEEPFASASIGQVHRARLADGREVAVKVQHPGIEQAVNADLANGRSVASIITAAGPRAMNVKAMYDEVAARFREELDYELEAQRQREFRALHAGDPFIRIPDVIAPRSARRVLTSELARGAALDDVTGAPEHRRRHYAEVLWQFAFKSILVAGAFNADPHPGNYLFGADGSVTFLDFGCVQSLPAEQLARYREMHRAAIRGDEPAFRDAVRALFGTRGGAFEQAMIDHTRRCFEPLFSSPYRITGAFVAELVRGIQQLKRFMISRDPSFVPMPPSLLLLNRLQFGFYSVLRRLEVTVDYRAVEQRLPSEAGLR
jgi:predicted unusual protein kinase regulating ubiquinone biosynthesis (AarF/ABC1/UbiB family)